MNIIESILNYMMEVYKFFLRNLKEIKRLLFNDLYSLIVFFLYYRYLISSDHKESKYSKGVTVVITSCNRPKELRNLLVSFVKFNTYKISKFIIVEDAGCKESVEIARQQLKDENLKILLHSKNIGQLNSIDEAYAFVDTEYIFHLEEDWEFIKSGFIENSIGVFEKNSKLVSLSLRPHADWNKWEFEKKVDYYGFEKSHNFIWQGISINPGIYKKANYDLLGSYEKFKKERIVVQAYRSLGLIGGISLEENGYVIHKGENNTTRKKYKVA
ncbi:glycosyltransferase [Polynucleobacter sp. VK25]|uniref:glycosyltransferase family 2 protein n=1 Tax=Polynucleobacter sp. VK25 TaxID=1758398 RepID=UPI001BFCD907|nr:glycosyltransferase [Polynucleobacter sp. VK25]QWD68643.1 glycosyltransferase [Polynucleobacter sp. VK25]